MSHPTPHPHAPARARRSLAERRRSFWLMVVLLLIWSVCLGIGMAHATEPHATDLTPRPETIAQSPTPAPADPTDATAIATPAVGTVDVVPAQFQAGQTLYLENCATCHIPIPPAVLPSQTWQDLIQDPEHYGATIRPLQSPEVQVLWRYLREYSRPLVKGETTPYRIRQSQIFRALHPRVTLPEKVTLSSCVSCHPGAGTYDFRRLSSEWQNAP